MAEYWINVATGSEAGAGTELDPWLLIPGQTGANTVANNDYLNIRTGLDYTAGGRIVVPKTGLTYRGYGVADNVLVLSNLPLGSQRVVRKAGVHEGMWILRNDPYASWTYGLIGGSQQGTTIQDAYLDGGGYAVDSPTSFGIYFGTSSTTASGGVVERCHIKNCTNGIGGYQTGRRVDKCKIERMALYGLAFSAASATGYKAGITESITDSELIDCGWTSNTPTDPITVDAGYLGHIDISNIYIYKTATTKQAMLIQSAAGGINIHDVLIDGNNVGSGSLCLAEIAGTVDISRVTFNGCTTIQPVVRFITQANSKSALASGAVVNISDIRVIGDTCGSLMSWNSSAYTSTTIDGTVNISGVYVEADVPTTALSTGAFISAIGTAGITVAATAELHVSNITLNGTIARALVRLPSGTEASSKYTFTNVLAPAGSWYIGSTEYATLALFAVAKTVGLSTCRELVDGDLDDAGRPKSAIKYIGTHNGYCNDPTGRLRHNPPTVGAYEFFDPAA